MTGAVASSDAWLALCGLALGLGVRHAFDPDHLSVIDGMARRNAEARPMLARLTGVLFSVGHGGVALITAVAALRLAAQWRLPGLLEIAGTMVSIVFLLGLAALNLRAAWTTSRAQRVRPIGFKSRLFKGASSEGPVAIVLVRMLFAISFDTLSQIAALSVSAAHFGGVDRALLAAACFAVGMVLAGGLNGLWISHLISAAGRRAAIASRIMTVAVGLLNLAVGGLALAGLIAPAVAAWSNEARLLLGGCVIATAACAFVVAMLAGRLTQKRRIASPGPLRTWAGQQGRG